MLDKAFRPIDLSSKEAYLQWVKEWKAEYQKIATRLRELRVELAKPHVLSMVSEWYIASSATPLLYERYGLRHYATALLEVRKNGKELSWKAKQEKVSVHEV